MNDAEISSLQAYKEELIVEAKRGGALVAGVADANAFTMAPEGHRPTDLLPDAKAVFVVGGAQPRAADWRSPNHQHMETSSTSDRVSALALKLYMIQQQWIRIAVKKKRKLGETLAICFGGKADF